MAGFDAAMAEQKAKARAAWAGSGEAKEASIWFDLAETHGPTEFLGYDTEKAEGQILALVADGQPVDRAEAGGSGAADAEPDAVLCRIRRPGRRCRHRRHRDRPRPDHRCEEGRRGLRAFRRGDRGRHRPRAGRGAGGRSCPPQRDPRQPFGDASAERGAARHAGRPCRAARLAERARPAAVRLRPWQGAERRANWPRSRRW